MVANLTLGVVRSLRSVDNSGTSLHEARVGTRVYGGFMTQQTGRVRVYIACSLDGFIAGPDDELAWLTEPRDPSRPLAAGTWGDAAPTALSYDDFIADVGAMLMGRGTFDVVKDFDTWYYGDLPVLVATSRPLGEAPATVSAVQGEPRELVQDALERAGGKDVYVDGGNLIRQCLDAGLIDDLTVTINPTILGAGVPLFAGTEHAHELTVTDVAKYTDGLVQLRMRPAGGGARKQTTAAQ